MCSAFGSLAVQLAFVLEVAGEEGLVVSGWLVFVGRGLFGGEEAMSSV